MAAFLGLTGSQLNARDALQLSIGTHVIDHESRQELVERLLALPWAMRGEQDNAELIEQLLSSVHKEPSDLENEAALPDWQVTVDDLLATADALSALAGASPLIDKGLANLLRVAQRLPRLCSSNCAECRT